MTRIKAAIGRWLTMEFSPEKPAMTIRDVLVHLDATDASQARARIAADLAGRSGAQLSGVFLTSAFMRNHWAAEAIAYLPPDSIDALLRDHARGVAEASEKARAIFDQAARDAGVRSDWRDIDGDSDDMMIRFARRVDLTVFPAVATACFGLHEIPAAELALSCGGPVLVTPGAPSTTTVGKRILIAWKGTRESARALRDAWPLVTQADEVHVLMVAPPTDDGSDSLLQRHLEHHGRRGDIIVERSPDASTPDILRRQVESLRADLLVMGLYSRPRLAERVLGGVSDDLLRDPPCALLVSH